MSRGESRGHGERGRIEKRTATQLALLAAFVLATLVWWWEVPPSAEPKVFVPVVFAPMDAALAGVEYFENGFGSTVQRLGKALPGYDDVVVFADGTALASGMDGWIWQIDLSTAEAERWMDDK
jgi:hypothetical protein